jgi:phosphoribosylanthranilate isomerase
MNANVPSATPVRVKICGITSSADAQIAVQAGADYIGLIFAERSPRRVPVEVAQSIAQAVRSMTDKTPVRLVGVFQNQSLADVAAIAEQVPLNFIQLHGEEEADADKSLPLPIIRFAPMVAEDDASSQIWSSEAPIGNPVALLLEPPKGSGLALPQWLVDCPQKAESLRSLSKTSPLFLAGGLNPGNIAAVLQHIRPFAIDVASGVESSPGVKNPEQVRDFCATIKGCHSDFSGDPTLCNRLDFSGRSAAFTSPNP